MILKIYNTEVHFQRELKGSIVVKGVAFFKTQVTIEIQAN